MKKALLWTLIILISFCQKVFAEKIPVRISPTEVISTHRDEFETGDLIKFETTNDVYVNDKLYIKKGTSVLGLVDFYHPNGWAADCAEIKFKKFETKDVEGKKVVIDYPLSINGICSLHNDLKYHIALYLTKWLRGSEIFIEPDSLIFNIFLVK